MRFSLLAALALIAFRPCRGGELVYLSSGFTLEVQSHVEQNQKILCNTASGTLELESRDVARIEAIADRPKIAAPLTATAAQNAVDLLARAANRQGLPPELVRSVAKVESGFRQEAVSTKGALGLMQLMPRTATELGVVPQRAEENAEGGARYLRDLLIRYHYDSVLALAAYNAGPGAVDRYHGLPPYVETRQYVIKVLREYERQQKQEQAQATKAGDSNRGRTATNKPSARD